MLQTDFLCPDAIPIRPEQTLFLLMLEEAGFEWGLLKSVIEGGFFNVLVGISTFNTDVQVFIAQKPGKWSANLPC